MNTPPVAKKTRHIGLYEYFTVLQREYVEAEYRSKFYTTPQDRQRYRKVAEMKRVKIEDIATRNGLSTIFDDPVKRASFFTRRAGVEFPKGMELTQVDQHHYFAVNHDVRVLVREQSKESLMLGHIYLTDYQTGRCEIVGHDDNLGYSDWFPFAQIARLV